MSSSAAALHGAPLAGRLANRPMQRSDVPHREFRSSTWSTTRGRGEARRRQPRAVPCLGVDLALPLASGPISGSFAVPASKSIEQRVLALAALSEAPVTFEGLDGAASGRDVTDLRAALAKLGTWRAGALGASRASLTLDLGLGATGFRLATALATLRPAGARTLVTGRPALLARPHRELRRALQRLGGHVIRKPSGAHRVIAGGLRGGALTLGCRSSSQHVTALMILAPRLGGLSLRLAETPVSRSYLRVTGEVLTQFGIRTLIDGLGEPRGHIEVAGGAPVCARARIEPDASAAAFWWAAATVTGGEVVVQGLPAESEQADMALLPVLESMGAQVETTPDGAVRVRGPGTTLSAPGEVYLGDAPDLLPLMAALAALARGTTRLCGAAHARGKESDRLAASAEMIVALGGRVEVLPDGLLIEGGSLHAGVVSAAGDHRIAFAAGLLGLVVPGVLLRGAAAASKSHPTFLAELARAAGA